ncbi:YigZ family protein [Mesomycoplasma molare]|uniref:YigZ family protein n=1 Tax=Mesomycoplasma molare TaxID=171288 RepID=A0ABY5TTF7_9BACT|nr:YigZ family protein [Mesomycoplasma molare]UWD33949.1 YigZ family protein [Mesomycoplasma molare]
MNNLYEIKKSKFYSFIFDIKEKSEVKTIIENLRQEHKKARHICYAYVVKESDGIIYHGMSDDKEPSGTAGKPLLNLLKIKNIENKILIVVRYFGGVKLGASLLLRSYLNSANLILK